MVDEFFFGDVVPEANFSDNIVQCSLGYHFVNRDSDVMLPQRCDLPQSNVAASLPDTRVT